MKTIPFTAAHTYIAHIWQSPPDLRLSPNQARPWRSFTKFLPPSQRKSHSLRIPTRRRRDQNIEPVPGVQIARPPPPQSPPVFPVYNLTLSPLTSALFYLNAWNRLSLFIILPILECESKHWKNLISTPNASKVIAKFHTKQQISPFAINRANSATNRSLSIRRFWGKRGRMEAKKGESYLLSPCPLGRPDTQA